MGDILGGTLFYLICYYAGLYTRYFFFWVTGDRRTAVRIMRLAKGRDRDIEKEVSQDYKNGIVGFVVVFLALILIGVFISSVF